MPRKTAAENPPVHDEVIGTLLFDERLQWFAAEHSTGSRLIALHIKSADRGQAIELVHIARELLDDLNAIDLRCKQLAAQKLLDLKNRAWRDTGEGAFTEARFTASISLESISIDRNAE